MKKLDFEEKIKKLGLEKVLNTIKLPQYITKSKNIYMDKEALHIYACYKNKNNEYAIFFKDIERAITTELGSFKTEEDAYEKLFGILEKTYNER